MLALLSIFLDVLLPVFTLVLIGYFAGPRLHLEVRSLSRVAYYILTPAFIFNIFSDAALEVNLAVRMALYAIVVAACCVVLAVMIAQLLRQGPEMAAAYALVAAFANVGNFGLPIIQFKMGEEALVPASFYFLVLSNFGFAVGVMAATWHKGGGLGALSALVKTPAILAVIPAVAVNVLDVPLPLFLDRAVGLLAAAMIP